LKKLTNITDLKQELHLHFCYNFENSVSSMQEAAESSGVVTRFSSQYKLPSLEGKIIILNKFLKIYLLNNPFYKEN